MNFLQLAKARYSLRKYSDKPVEPEKPDPTLPHLIVSRFLLFCAPC